MHLLWSIAGALKPLWERAPTGQTLTAGQGWFCGQLSLINVSNLAIIFSLRVYTVILSNLFNYYKRFRKQCHKIVK